MAGRILALDVGDVRIGVAVSDPTGTIAQPLEVYRRVGYGPDSRYVAELCRRMGCESVLLGLPLNMDGSCGDRAKLCEEFADKLRELVTVPVELWDERQTTVSAIGYLNETNTRGKKRKQVIDAVAATIILENYLAYRKNQREE